MDREKIINAARKLIGKQGLKNFNMRSLARDLNASTMVIYHQFKNKDELAFEVYQKIDEEIAELFTAVERQKNPLLELIELGVCYRYFAKKNPNEFSLIFEILSSQIDGCQRVKKAKSYKIMKDTVKRCKRFAVLRKMSTESMTDLLWTFQHGFASLETYGLYGDENTTADRYRDLYNIMAGGIKNPLFPNLINVQRILGKCLKKYNL